MIPLRIWSAPRVLVLAHEATGDLRSALAARVAPREELKAAMDPANIPEVFHEQKLASGGTMTRIDFNLAQ